MYSLSNRLNTVFFFGVTSIAVLAVFNIASTIFLNNQPIVYNFFLHEHFSLYAF